VSLGYSHGPQVDIAGTYARVVNNPIISNTKLPIRKLGIKGNV
jgi:hypothetical protein